MMKNKHLGEQKITVEHSVCKHKLNIMYYILIEFLQIITTSECLTFTDCPTCSQSVTK